jgi:L-lactate dehydrogenase complex protein LldG
VNAEELRTMRELLQAALRTAVLPGATADPPGTFHREDPAGTDLLPRFTAELTALGGTVHHLPTHDAASVAGLIASIVQASSPPASRRALIWDDQWLPVRNLRPALDAVGITPDAQREDDLASQERRLELAAACVGITSADACLAETGSIVLVSGPGRGRLASLLPPVHVALVTRALLVRSLPDVLAQQPQLAASGSNLVCITGPSRTADIEHTLSRGVHGPREVHVVFCG